MGQQYVGIQCPMIKLFHLNRIDLNDSKPYAPTSRTYRLYHTYQHEQNTLLQMRVRESTVKTEEVAYPTPLVLNVSADLATLALTAEEVSITACFWHLFISPCG